jgi:hypothetical protein
MIVYRHNGNFVKEFRPINSARKELKINSIDFVCRGLQNHAGGYIWKYKN